MRGKGLLHPFFVFLKNPGFQKTVLFIKNPGFQKDRPFHQKPGFSKRPVFLPKTRVFKGSEVLTGQRKNPGFVFKGIFQICVTRI